MAWTCATFGQDHSGIPLSFAADYPDNFHNMTAEERELRAIIGTDQCIIDGKEFYIRGLLEIPIRGADEPFLWGLWASVWEQDFDLIGETWETAGRENTVGPFKGRLANRLAEYSPSTADLKLSIRIMPAGERPCSSSTNQSIPWRSLSATA